MYLYKCYALFTLGYVNMEFTYSERQCLLPLFYCLTSTLMSYTLLTYAYHNINKQHSSHYDYCKLPNSYIFTSTHKVLSVSCILQKC